MNKLDWREEIKAWRMDLAHRAPVWDDFGLGKLALGLRPAF